MAIWWIRRDLRLTGHLALQAALSLQAPSGTLVFVLTRTYGRSRPSAGRHFYLPACARWRKICALWARGCLSAAATSLKNCRAWRRSGRTAYLRGGGRFLYARERDRLVGTRESEAASWRRWAGARGCAQSRRHAPHRLHALQPRLESAFPPTLTRKPLSLPTLPALASDDLPNPPAPANFPAGEQEAQRRLDASLDDQSTPTKPSATGWTWKALALSPYLRFCDVFRPAGRPGAAREPSAPMESARAGAETWLNELIWRFTCPSCIIFRAC